MKATQQGAEAYEPTQEDEKAVEEAQQQRLNDKNEEMTEIAARHRETRDKELAEAGHEVQDTTQEVVEIEDPNEEPEEEQPEEKAEEQVEEKAEEQEEPDEFETLIVDGQEQKVGKDKIYDAGRRTLQKEAAADKRLAEASEKLRQAEQELARARQLPREDADTALSDSPDVKAAARAVLDGDFDEVESALSQIVKAVKQPTLNPSDISAQIKDTIAIEQAMELFEKDPKDGGYGDLYENKRLRQMVLDEEESIFNADNAAGQRRSPLIRFKEAASTVRQFRDELAGKAQPAIDEKSFDDLKSKKSQAENTPDSAGGRLRTGDGAQEKVTPSKKRKNALDAMKAARGQDLD